VITYLGYREEVGSGDSMLVYTMRRWCIGILVVVRMSNLRGGFVDIAQSED